MVKITNTQGYTLDQLKTLERQTTGIRMRLRLMAIRLVWEGYPAVSAAHIIGLTGETVGTFVRAWNRGGPEALIPRKAPGHVSKIPPDIEAAILAALESTPKAVGYGIAVHWDSRVLQAFLADRYQITMHRGALRKWLTRKGFTWTRPTYTLVQADPVKQQTFREDLDTLKKP